MLAFGSGSELFLTDGLEDAIKSSIEEKDKRKTILAELDQAKKAIKQRETLFKEYQSISAKKDVEQQQLLSVFAKVEKLRIETREPLINIRTRIFSQFTDNEWQNIHRKSVKSFEANLADRQHELLQAEIDGKAGFYRTRKALIKNIEDEHKRSQLLTRLNATEQSIRKTAFSLISVNVRDNKVLSNRAASAEEFNQLLQQVNKKRSACFQKMIELQLYFAQSLNEKEWKPVIKALMKDVRATDH